MGVSMKKLSVIIPMYNVSNFVARAAKSIASQWHEDVEVVVIDDGSTDDSFDVCISLLSSVDAIVIKQKNAGLSAARNAGINAATGEYLLFLDADDFLLPDAFNNILAMLEQDKPDVLFGTYLFWRPKTGFSPAKVFAFNPPSDAKKRTDYILGSLPQSSWNAWRYICRRSFIVEHGLFFEEGLLCEDVPWTLAMLESTETIAFLEKPFYAYYHRRPKSIMASMNPQRLIDLNSSVGNLLKQYKDRPVIYDQLIWQSFLYICEYCLFKRKNRMRILESYRRVLPQYKYSSYWLHRVGAKCAYPALFYGLSVLLYITRWVRRAWTGIRRAIRL